MKKIESLAAAHPKVGTVLSPETETVRGQLYSLGFTLCDVGDKAADWLVTDDTTPTPTGVPVLHITGKVSIYGLTQAIIRLFEGGNQG